MHKISTNRRFLLPHKNDFLYKCLSKCNKKNLSSSYMPTKKNTQVQPYEGPIRF